MMGLTGASLSTVRAVGGQREKWIKKQLFLPPATHTHGNCEHTSVIDTTTSLKETEAFMQQNDSIQMSCQDKGSELSPQIQFKKSSFHKNRRLGCVINSAFALCDIYLSWVTRLPPSQHCYPKWWIGKLSVVGGLMTDHVTETLRWGGNALRGWWLTEVHTSTLPLKCSIYSEVLL